MSENNILEYYEQISERYFAARIFPDGKVIHLWQPLAKRIKVTGYEDFDMFIYCEKKCFYLCESLTGAVLLRQCDFPTRQLRRLRAIKELLKYFPEALNERGGRPAINQLIVNFMVDHDQIISPRYTPKKV